jgi:hypothetical protein
MKPLTFVANVLFSLAAIITSVVLGWWQCDVWSDRRHTMLVTSPTPIYAGAGDGQVMCEGGLIVVARPRSSFQIRRIRYWKNCATVDVKLQDGQIGHIAYLGTISIKSPLNQ